MCGKPYFVFITDNSEGEGSGKVLDVYSEHELIVLDGRPVCFKCAGLDYPDLLATVQHRRHLWHARWESEQEEYPVEHLLDDVKAVWGLRDRRSPDLSRHPRR